MPERADELEYLRWFHAECDFGPAHEDVIYIMQDSFEATTGKRPPSEYDIEYEE